MSVAAVRRTLPALALAVFAALAVAAPASAATVVNGDFETGTLAGWTQSSTGTGGWSAYSGTTNPRNGHAIAAPPMGTWAAVSGQTGGSRTILYQDIPLEAGRTHILEMQVYYTNENATLHSPDTLSDGVQNQQYRIDVLRPTAPVDSVAPADILTTIFRTQPGDANVRGPFPVTSDLSAFAGQTVRLRFAQMSTDFYFSASVDEVCFASMTPCPKALALGRQDIDNGPAVSRTSRVRNDTPAPVTLSGLSLSGDTTQFELLTGASGDCTATTVLAAGEGCDLRVRFDPTTTGAKAATLTVASSEPDGTVALTGTGIQTEATLSPDTLAYGSREINNGPTVNQTSTVTNSGTEPVVLSGLILSGDATQFERLTGSSGDCTATTTLAAGATCGVRVRFDPSSIGAKAATLTVTSNAPDRTIALTGTGLHAELTPSPGTLPFGSLDIDEGPTVSQTSTLTNSGTESVTLSGLSLSGDSTEFEHLTGDAGDCTATTTLAAGDACDVRVRFDPTAVGSKAATLTIASSAADRTVALTGTGIQTEATPSPDTLAFGSREIDDGPTVSQTSTVTNSGTESVTLSGLSLSGDSAQFEHLSGVAGDCTASTTLAAGETCDVRVHFDPSSIGAKSATLTIASNAADRAVALTGTGIHTELTAGPDTQAFGGQDIDDGSTASQTSTVTNSGTESVTLSGLSLSGDTAEFEHLSGAAGDCTATTTLAAGDACDVRVRFDPTALGAKSATLTIASSAADRTVALTGTGIQTEATLSPDTLAFGSREIDDDATVSQTSTLTNSGTEPVTLSGLSLSGDSAQFEHLSGDAGDCTATTTLAAGDTCDVRVHFDPSSIGGKAATLTVTSNTSDLTVALTGTGIHTDLTAGPDTLAFGGQDIDDGPTVSQTSTVTNNGTEPVTLSGLSLSGNSAQFDHLTGDADDCTATTTLAAGDACDVRVRFDPTATGGKAATLTIASSTADRTVALTGTGGQVDTDGDGISDRFDTDDDGDGTPDSADAFPLDPAESADTDGDGIGNHADTDDDGDGTPDSADAFPLDPAESVDTDGDGIGNHADTDDDGDGTPDSADAFPLDPARHEVARPSVAAVVNPWRLERRAKVTAIERATGLRVRTGYVAVCPAGGPACSGRLTLKILRRSLTSGGLVRVFMTRRVALTSLPAGTARRVNFTLSARAARLLKRAGPFRATLRGSVRVGAGARVVRTASLRISAPRQP